MWKWILSFLLVVGLSPSEARAVDTRKIEVFLPPTTFMEGSDWITVIIDGSEGGFWELTPVGGVSPKFQARVFAGDGASLRPVGETIDGDCLVYETSVLRPRRLTNGKLEFGVPPSWLGIGVRDEIEERTFTIVFEESDLPSGKWAIAKSEKEKYFWGAYRIIVVPTERLARARPREVTSAVAAAPEKYRLQALAASTEGAEIRTWKMNCIEVAEYGSSGLQITALSGCIHTQRRPPPEAR